MREPVITAVFERDDVGDVAGLDQFDHKPTARWVVDGGHHTVGQRDEVDDRKGCPPAECQDSKQECQRRLATLGQHGHLSLVDPIRYGAGPDTEHQHRQELTEQRQPDVGRLAGEAVHQQ